MADILVLPGMTSSTGLAEGPDLLAQEFLLALLNTAQNQPYLPANQSNPLANMLLKSSNLPQLNEVVLAFNMSVTAIRRIILTTNPDFLSANLVKVSYTDSPGGIIMTIQLRTRTGVQYVTRTFQFESTNG